MNSTNPPLYTSLSPALLHLYDVSSSIVVIIDVLRATSTIATALYNGATRVIRSTKSCYSMDMILDFPQLAVAICKSVVTAAMTGVIEAC